MCRFLFGWSRWILRNKTKIKPKPKEVKFGPEWNRLELEWVLKIVRILVCYNWENMIDINIIKSVLLLTWRLSTLFYHIYPVPYLWWISVSVHTVNKVKNRYNFIIIYTFAIFYIVWKMGSTKRLKIANG
jgi:hypothetical protein